MAASFQNGASFVFHDSLDAVIADLDTVVAGTFKLTLSNWQDQGCVAINDDSVKLKTTDCSDTLSFELYPSIRGT